MQTRTPTWPEGAPEIDTGDRGVRPVARARLTTMRLLGVYAALLGLAHGAGAIAQGPGVVPTLPFFAIGAPCQPETAWHGCFPAATLVPDVRASGLQAVIASAAVAPEASA